ncbi:MAG: glycosyltransferase family 9 protein [Bacteroidia bacterium]|nr:glycosyltransferase family 9 protein [Bacteroidia bacterium]
MKVLVVSFTSRADLLFATPLLRSLKILQGDTEVHVCTQSGLDSVLEANPYVDVCHTFDTSPRVLRARLKELRFGAVIDLGVAWRHRSFVRSIGAPVYRAQQLAPERWLMVSLKVNKLPNKHIATRFLDAARPLGIATDDLGLDCFIPDRDDVPPEWLPDGFQHEWIAVCIQAPYNTRKLPVSRLIELCDKINKPIILLGDNDDAEAGAVVENFFRQTDSDTETGLKELNKKATVYNACGKFSFNQMASVVRKAKYVFTYDNDMLPVAAAFNKETFTLWGNTITLFGRYPYQSRFVVLENNKVSCRPCSSRGYASCPQGHFKCMNDIVFDFYLP